MMQLYVIRHITCTKSRVNFATMVPSTPSSINTKPTRYYSHLRAHTNKDFTMSIVQAHIDNHDDTDNDAVICYFALCDSREVRPHATRINISSLDPILGHLSSNLHDKTGIYNRI